MSKLSLNFVLRLIKYSCLLFLVFNLHASESIKLDKLLKKIDIASSFEDRRQGLMFRNSIPEDYGMFFIWERKKQQCMWMKDTFMPLSIAYISNEGEILEIYDMVPFSRKSVCSRSNVKYALEVNEGWFKKNNLFVGDVVNIESIISNDK